MEAVFRLKPIQNVEDTEICVFPKCFNILVSMHADYKP